MDPEQKIIITDLIPVLIFSLSIVINRYISNRQDSSSSKVHRGANIHDDVQERRSKDSTSSNKEMRYMEQCLPSHVIREFRKEERRIAKMPLLAMKKNMYDNCELLAPDGTLLSTISKKKAQWYKSKGLGTWTSDKENQILLNFEPKSRSLQSYGISKKENMCVICGGAKNHIRFYIVPYVYRALFPTCYKAHMSHDVVIVCGYCHIHCEKHVHIRMRELEVLCRPCQGYPPQYTQDPHLYHIRSCAIALKQWKHKLPLEKIQDYESVVANYIRSIRGDIQMTNLLTEDLELAINVEYQVENPQYIPPSDFVVKKLASNEDQIQVFVRGWRQYFLHMNRPQYLPIGWKIDYPVRCDTDPSI